MIEVKKTYEYKIGKTNIVFNIIEGEKIRLIHFSPEPFNSDKKLPTELIEASTIIELHVTGFNQPDHKGNKLGNSLVGRELKLIGIECNEDVIKIVQEYRVEPYNINIETTIDGSFEQDVFTWTNKVKNLGEKVGLEYITSVNATALNESKIPRDYTKDKLHIPHNSWQGELQWKSNDLKSFGLEKELDGEKLQDSTKVISVTNNSTWSCSQYSPFAILENKSANISTFWQIETNGEWHWEISDCGFGKYSVLRACGPTLLHNHWWKELGINEEFITVPVSHGVISGDVQDVYKLLNKYRRKIRRDNIDNKECPIIFNDYMNCLMGDPTTEKEVPMIDKAAEIGCEYYVIDCGWYSDGYWWDNVGEWKESRERFPEGIKYLTEYIQAKGMTAGLWLEIEAMGINSDFANSLPDTWFICRHGKRIKDHSRYHLDFRNDEVRKYASSVIDRLIKEYKIGYIKMDYNTPTSFGSDLNADSFSDSLLDHNRSYLKWIDTLFKKYPGLVIENCGSGGMRHDYAMLSRHSIQSVTDQTDYIRNGAIAAVCATGVTPEQAAIWSYPLSEGDDEEVIFNMINSILFRIHQSGHLTELSNERLKLVKEGIDVYKEIRSNIQIGDPAWYTGIPLLDDEWFSYSMETSDTIYIAIWRTISLKDNFVVDIPYDVKKAMQLYPVNETQTSQHILNGNSLSVNFKENKMARLYKIEKLNNDN